MKNIFVDVKHADSYFGTIVQTLDKLKYIAEQDSITKYKGFTNHCDNIFVIRLEEFSNELDILQRFFYKYSNATQAYKSNEIDIFTNIINSLRYHIGKSDLFVFNEDFEGCYAIDKHVVVDLLMQLDDLLLKDD